LVDVLHAAAIQLIVWTVDDPADMEQLLGLGVDGICTNRPEIGRRAVDARAA
jgi:glycerophosphoryl diester phosphodiesterase